MDVFKIFIIVIVGIITAVILKSYRPEFAVFIIIAISFLFMGWVLSVFGEIKNQFESLGTFYEENQYFYKILFKIIGITYLCELMSGICKDAGYSSIAVQVELWGKVLVLLSGMPVLTSIIRILYEYKTLGR